MYLHTHLLQKENELGEAIEQLSRHYVWARDHGYNVLARAYLVGQAELLRNKAEIKDLIRLAGGEQ